MSCLFAHQFVRCGVQDTPNTDPATSLNSVTRSERCVVMFVRVLCGDDGKKSKSRSDRKAGESDLS